MPNIKLLFFAISFLICSNCCSFEPIIEDGWTKKCNVMFSVMRFGDKKIAVLAWEKCNKSIDVEKCQQEYFGVNPVTKVANPVDYQNSVNLTRYNRCLKEQD